MPRLIHVLLFVGSMSLTSAWAQDSTEQDFYEQALVDYQQQNFANAFNAVKTALQIKPEHLPSRILYGEILLQFGEFAAAENQFKRALSFNADTSLVLPKLAQVLLVQNKHSEIIDTILANSLSDEVNYVILMYRGKAFESLKRYPEAAAEFEQAGLIYPERAAVSLALASIADKQNRRDAYHRLLDKARDAAPGEPIVQFFEAERLRENGRLELALEFYNDILKVVPDYHDVRRTRAAVLLDLEQTSLALEDLNYLLEAAPQDPFTLLLQAVALGKSENAKEADRVLNDIVGNLSVIDKEIYEDFAPIHFLNGAAQFLMGKYVNAERHLLKALEANPSSLNVREMLAEIALSNLEHRKAIDILSIVPVSELAVRSIEILSTAYLNIQNYDAVRTLMEALPRQMASLPQFVKLRSAALFKSGQAQVAIQSLSESKTTETDEKALLMLGYHALSVSDFDLAMDIVERLAENSMTTITALNFSGAVYLAQGQAAAAKSYFEQALQNNPNDVVTQLNLIQSLKLIGDSNKAESRLQQLVQRFPNNVDVLKARLEMLKGRPSSAEYGVTVTRLAELVPEDRRVLISAINYHLAANSAESALPILTRLKDTESFWPPTLIAESKVNLKLGRIEQAQKPLRVLFGLVESNHHLVKLGEEFFEAGAMEFVNRTLVRLEKAGYQEADAIRLKAQYQYQAGDQQSALKSLIALTKEKPEFENHFLLAKLLAQSNEKASALYYAKQANRKQPSIETIRLLANIHWQLGEREEALAAVESYIQQRPQDSAVAIVYANMLQQSGQIVAAQNAYLAVLEQHPGNLFSLVNLSRLYIQQAQFNSANPFILKAFEKKPNDAVILDLYGWVEVNLGNVNEGLNLLRDSYSRNASSPSNLYHLAYALNELDRQGESKQLLRRAIAMATDFPERALAQALLDTL